MKHVRRLALLLVMVAGIVLVADALRALTRPMMLGALPQVIEMAPGDTWSHLVSRMRDKGWLQHRRDALYLRLYGRFRPEIDRIKAGEYRIDSRLTADQLIALLVSGKVVEYAFTIVEGWRLDEMLGGLRSHEAIKATLPESPQDAATELQETLSLEHDPEGWFLPETYHFTRGSTDVALLRRAHAAMQETVDAAWANRDSEIPLESPYDLLTLASIIEKETAVASERHRIAGVFARRLEQGMLLQTDPTVLYGRDPARSGRLLRRDLETDTPYNTYTRSGLPPTPICLPGRAAIEAAAHPAEGTTLYFVSRNDGTHVFSDTLQEHNRAVDRFQRSGK